MDSGNKSRSSRRKPIKTHRVSADSPADNGPDERAEILDDVSGFVVSHSDFDDTSNTGSSEPTTAVEDDTSTLDSSSQISIVLPEGTIIVHPEAADDNSFDGPEFSNEQTENSLQPSSRGHSTNTCLVHCTACSYRIDITKSDVIYQHPVLKVLLCKKCHENQYRKTAAQNGKQCKWCAAGVDLICCDFCPAMFCKVCIRRNLGRYVLHQILNSEADEKWQCFVCDPQPLARLVETVTELVSSIDNASQHLPSQPNERHQLRSNGKTKIPTPTIGNSSGSISELSEPGTDLAVTEYNIWQVIEKLLAATQSMSMLLGSLTDDLRRTGAIASAAEPQNAKKRREVATKLWRAFVAYRKSFNDIETFSKTSGGSDDATAAAAAAASRTFSSRQSQRPKAAVRSLPPAAPPAPVEVIELSDSDDESVGSSSVGSQPPIKRRCESPSCLDISATNIENGGKKQEGLDMTVDDYSNGSCNDESSADSSSREQVSVPVSVSVPVVVAAVDDDSNSVQ